MSEKKNFAWPVTAVSKEDYDAVVKCVNNNLDKFKSKKILIFGAGIRGANISVILEKEGFDNIIFSDNNQEKWGGVIDKYSVISPREMLTMLDQIVILVSVEENKEICIQLCNYGLIENETFFIPKADLYDQFIYEFDRKMCNHVLVMGDCMFEVIGFNDTNKSSLKELCMDRFGRNDIKLLTMHGMGMPAFYHIFKAQIDTGMKPNAFIVMINFETLTGKQHLLPRSQHTELMHAIQEIAADPDKEFEEYVKLVDKRVKNIQAEFFTTDRYQTAPEANNNVGEISLKAAKIFIKLNYMYKLNPEMESILYLKKILALGNELAVKIIPFVPPVNYELGEQLFGTRFEEAYNYNLSIIKNLIDESGFELLDLSHICKKELFCDITTPDETTNFEGRTLIADKLYEEAERIIK